VPGKAVEAVDTTAAIKAASPPPRLCGNNKIMIRITRARNVNSKNTPTKAEAQIISRLLDPMTNSLAPRSTAETEQPPPPESLHPFNPIIDNSPNYNQPVFDYQVPNTFFSC
jgi:hypothetical protein